MQQQQQMANDRKKMGPKIYMKDKCPLRIEFEDEELDAGDGGADTSLKQSMKQSKKIVYLNKNAKRFDKLGNLIEKGGGYGISFDMFITVCVFERTDEVIYIRESLRECENYIDQSKINLRLDTKFKSNNSDEIVLASILKQRK